MSSFFLRTESIKPNDIVDLCVLNSNDQDIIDALISSEPVLLEGSRGTGKTFLTLLMGLCTLLMCVEVM